MLKPLLLGASILALTSPAFAADMVTAAPSPAPAPAPVIFNWTGFYAGVFAGGATSHATVLDVDGYNSTGYTFGYHPNGFFGGAYGGYNWQYGHFVFGAEGELGYLGLDGSAQYPPFVGVRGPNDSVASLKSDFYASLTGRLGYAFDNVLVYAKGGVVGLNTKVSYIDTDPTGTTLVSGTSETKFLGGYTVGAGVEMAITPRWLLKGEYMFADYGKISNTALSSGGTSYTFTHDLKEVHTFKVGLAYKF